MSISTCHSQLPSPTDITPDSDIPNLMDINSDNRRQSSLNDKRTNNVNYVRHVLRKFFGGYSRKSSATT